MSHSLRVIFAGTPEFAAAALAAIHSAGFPVPLVLTQPTGPPGADEIAGESGQALRAGARTGRRATAFAAPRRQISGEAAAAIDQLRATPHDVMVVAAYG
jgi:Methionyl-tRNA formyltransferase